ncbi:MULTISPECIES: pectinesterase family protein [Paenibacillus]|uniref:Pectinesterase family protein n=1 Tax=Paenibacillus rhizoplanae TaxID=1917181 RepID=A0ABW5F423_9BACL
MLIIVSKNAGEGFSSLQGALDSIPPGEMQAVTIQIKPGIYEEKVTVAREAPPMSPSSAR